ncbi:MAG: hypothetical protein R2706_10205 [Acidimicrobiales bacterium]
MLVTPNAQGVTVPDGVVVVGADELERSRLAYYHEDVGEVRYRISADSFFQCRPDGAAALVALVRDGLGNIDGPLLDAYSGVGLFGAALGADRPLFAVESSRSSTADARVNLGSQAEVVRQRFERWLPKPVAAVVADPARSGLDKPGVGVIDGTGAKRCSCELRPGSPSTRHVAPSSSRVLLDRVTVVDLFGETSHIEAVSVFSR